MNKKQTLQRKERGSPLYSFVYSSKFSFCVVFVLLLSLAIQSIDRAFADNSGDSPPILPLINDDFLDKTLEVSDFPVSDSLSDIVAPAVEELPAIDSVSDVYGEVVTESIQNELEFETTETLVDITQTEPETNSSSDNLSDSNNDVATETGSLTEDNENDVNEDGQTIATETVSTDILPEISSTTLTTASTSSDELVASTSQTVIVENDRAITFKRDDCVLVEDGTYYCQKIDSTKSEVDALVSLPDADGDLEIFLKRDGDLTQLTFNTFDDAAPYFDQLSNSIVWHRLIEDRYQIVVYDVETQNETQLTDTVTNNMEPHRFGEYITWQYWNKNSWQIMLYHNGEVSQLTDSIEQHIAPVIRNGLVLWHRVSDTEKVIEVYDITSGTYTVIDDKNGGSLTNPRMVLVYDAALENGDVETRGYDLMTGEITSFNHIPVSLPENIPEPESTGETKALVQPKIDDEENESSVTDNSLPESDVELNANDIILSASSTTTELTLDMTVASSSYPDVEVEILNQPYPDLIIDFYSPSATSSLETI